MYIEYQPWDPKQESIDIVTEANYIIEDYEAQGYSVTLRQLYYQFVARGLIQNTTRNYVRLKTIMTKARLAGLVSWKAIEDRTRILKEPNICESESILLQRMMNSIKFDRWRRQGYHIEVWVEKEALGNVIERPCEALGIYHMACKGYMSSSALWRAGQRFQKAENEGLKGILIHLGDHDPSGLDMTRDNNKRAELFSGYSDITVRRIALNMDQIEEYDPPPNPAKETDSRAAPYIEEFGKYSWELDALEPSVIEKLIYDAVAGYKSWNIDQDITEQEDKLKYLMSKLYRNWDDVKELLEEMTND